MLTASVQCTSLHSYQLRKTGVFFLSSNSASIQLGNTKSCSASSHEDGEGQDSERMNREEHRDTALGRLCTSHTENMNTHNEGFCCFLALFFDMFFFNFIKTIFLLRLVVQSYFSRTTIQSDSVSADKLPTDPFLTSILL